MFNKLSLFIVLILCLTLTGCTHDANRIYTICKVDDGVKYCYNSDGFYVVSDNNLTPTSSIGLKKYPALCIVPEEGDYVFEYQLPGFYKGTLTSVNRYAHRLIELGFTYEYSYADCNSLEVYFISNDLKVRLLYNIKGSVRIYCVDNSNNYITPPYLNEE